MYCQVCTPEVCIWTGSMCKLHIHKKSQFLISYVFTNTRGTVCRPHLFSRLNHCYSLLHIRWCKWVTLSTVCSVVRMTFTCTKQITSSWTATCLVCWLHFIYYIKCITLQWSTYICVLLEAPATPVALIITIISSYIVHKYRIHVASEENICLL